MQGPFFLGGLANVSVEIKYNLEVKYYLIIQWLETNFLLKL